MINKTFRSEVGASVWNISNRENLINNYYRIHNDNYSSRNLKNYIYEIKHWLKINKKMFDKQGFLMKNIIFQLLRLKTKYFFVKIKDFLGM